VPFVAFAGLVWLIGRAILYVLAGRRRCHGFRKSSGSSAMFAAMRRQS
jgi:hypothetical protein